MPYARTMEYDLFLAHASADKSAAIALYEALGALGVRAFLDARSIDPGERWDLVIPRAQRDARATVVMVTPRCDDAFYLGDEIATAIAHHREAPDAHAVIPAHMEGTPVDAFALPYGLRVINGIDVPALGGVVGLAAKLHELVVKWRGAPVAPPPPRPAADSRCAPAALHDRLCKLLDVQFEEVVMRAGLERTQIAAATAPQHRRALDVVGMVMQGGPEVCHRVCSAVEKVAPWLK